MNDKLEILKQLLDFLESIDGQESKQAIDASNIIKKSLEKLQENRETALKEIEYGLSYKGILDWYWEPHTYSEIDILCNKYHKLNH